MTPFWTRKLLFGLGNVRKIIETLLEGTARGGSGFYGSRQAIGRSKEYQNISFDILMSAPLEFSDSRLTRARNSDLRTISKPCTPEGDEETRHENLKDIGQDLAHHWVQPSARGKRIVRVLPPPRLATQPPRGITFASLNPPPGAPTKKKAKYRGPGGTGSAEVSRGQPGEWKCGKP